MLRFSLLSFGLACCAILVDGPPKPVAKLEAFPLANYITRPEVLDRLAINSEQKAEMGRAVERYSTSISSIKQLDMNSLRSIVAESKDRLLLQRSENEILDLARALNSESLQKFDDELALVLDPNQVDRLVGVIIQAEGAKAILSCKLLRDLLEVDAEQLERMQNLIQKEMKAELALIGIQELENYNKPNPGKINYKLNIVERALKHRSEIDKMRRAVNVEILSELSKKQQDSFEKMKGEPIKFIHPGWD